MEDDSRTDAQIARDRCLEAIVGASTEDAVSLWRAAKRYNQRMKAEQAGRAEIAPSLAMSVPW